MVINMATATVLRVKRRLEDNPQDALVLMCKRVKTDDEEILSSLFVFRGTVDSQENAFQSLVPKKEIQLKSKHNVNDIIEKIRQERKQKSADNRYEVVNCRRGLKEGDNSEADDIFDLVDLNLKQKAEQESEDVKYAYDLYISAKQDFDISMIDHLVGIENYETDLIFGSYRDNGRQSPSTDADDDEDSNDENNWRNDYPDSEPSSIDEEDMLKAMKSCDIENDLSSDDGEDKIYENQDPLSEDTQRYGAAYAKYKTRVLTEEPVLNSEGVPSRLIHCIKDYDEESIGYKEDSDDGFYYGQEEDTEQFKDQYTIKPDEYSPD